MRTTHQTLPTALAMDVMPPWRAFRTPSVPSALDPRRWFGAVLAVLAGVAGRADQPGTTARSPAEGMGS
jgi:hypothetical protein